MEASAKTVRQLADEEAARAEAENPDEEAEEGADAGDEAAPTEPAEPTEPPPSPAGVMTPEQVAELEKASVTYLRRVEKILAPNVPPLCEACGGVGFDLSGGAGMDDFPTTDQFKPCENCDGLGRLKTGSRVQGHELRDCAACQGRGYLERLDVAAPPPAEGGQAPTYGTPSWMGTVETSPPAPVTPLSPPAPVA